MAIPELQDTSGRLTDCIYFGDPISSSVGSGFVATTRTIGTTLPLTGGGDLSANRTLAINDFAGSVAGAVPPSTGGVVTFLRADGAWATPPTFGAAAAGYAPASGGGSTNYLRADGTWAAPAGTGIAGLTTDFYPVATSATSIGDGRIAQSTNVLTGYTSYTDSLHNAGLRVEDDGITVSIRSQRLNAPAFTVSRLGLYGGTGYGLELDGLTVSATNTFIATTEHEVPLSNGLNSNISIATMHGVGTSWMRITGPTTPFSIGGFLDTADGLIITVYNTTDQPLTIVNEDLSSIAASRIVTHTNSDVTLPANTSCATFIYSISDQRWILAGTSPAAQYPRTIGYVPYEDASHNLASSSLYFDLANLRYGFETATPKATVDINGTIAVRRYAQLLASGLNSDIPAPTTSFMRITGPAAAFSVGGIATVAGEDGKKLTIYNATSQAMTIVHEDLSSTAAYRINTLTGSNLVFPARQSVVHLAYNSATSRWIVEEANPVTAGGATTQVQHNLAGALSGDTGLVVSGTGTSKVLTLGTDVPLSRKATGHLELGVPGPAATAKIITGQSAIGGTDSNKAGGKLSVGGGAGTGTAGGGNTALVTAYPGTLGNTQNTHVDRLTYVAVPKLLTETVGTPCINVGVPTETGAGGTFWYTIYATDGTDMQIRRGRVEWGAVNKGGTITVVLGTPEEVDCTPTGTLTVTVGYTDIGNDTFDFELTAVSSLTQTTLEAWVSFAYDGKGAITTY